MHRQVEPGRGRPGIALEQPDPHLHLAEFIELLPAPHGRPAHPGGPLFGRERDVAGLTSLLADPNVRLITITGPGGVGKTRLALEAARRSEADFTDGLVVVSLAPVRDPAHVVSTIGQTIGLHRADPSLMLTRLVATLHEQRILLLLDNCEHVVDAGADIAQLLHGCPRLTILATSRAAIHIQDERLFPIAPLAVDRSPIIDDSELPGAIQLFLDRAHRNDPTFEPSKSVLIDVQEICRQLDGLPLAIELAAAHIGTISPRELKQRLDPRLSLLSHGYRDLPERQRTMRATIAWSYGLLSEQQRHAFRWLSVFVGGFRLAAAEALLRESLAGNWDSMLDGTSVIETIGALIASNLLHRSPAAGSDDRYAMLEVVREFGLELLLEHGELERAHRAHAAWYATNREWLDPNRFSSEERFIDHLWDVDAEHPNVRAALTRCAAADDYEIVLAIASNMAVFWHHRGFLGEGRAWLEKSLARAAEVPLELRCWALAGLGLIRWSQGDEHGARPILGEALAIANQIDHMELEALTLHVMALVEAQIGPVYSAFEHIDQALALWRTLELPSDVAMALHVRGGLPPPSGQPDHRMADMAESLAIFEQIGHTSGVAYCHHRFGRLALLAGDERLAYIGLARSIATWLSIDERWSIVRPLSVLAHLAARHGLARDAALLLGVGEQRLELSSATLAADYRAMNAEAIALAERVLGAAATQAAKQEGTRLSHEQINALIQALEPKLFQSSHLTTRETEVLEQIATGATDREVADSLFVSPRTIHTHVSHILIKLDVTSRREAVKRAQELGLIRTPPAS